MFVAQALQIKDEDYAILPAEISEVMEEISALKEGLVKLGRCLGLDLFPPNHRPREKASLTIPLDDEDCKPKPNASQLGSPFVHLFSI